MQSQLMSTKLQRTTYRNLDRCRRRWRRRSRLQFSTISSQQM